MSASIPLSTTLAAALVTTDELGRCTVSPGADGIEIARSTHVFGFSSHGALLLAESQGAFDLDTWERAFDGAKSLCCAADERDGSDDDDMDVDERHQNMHGILRQALQTKLAQEQRWKTS